MKLKYKLGRMVCGIVLVSTVLVSVPLFASESASYYGIVNLKLRSHGEQVKQVQAKLKVLGYFKSDVTGFYGPVTVSAVKSFQIKSGLPGDGIVGQKTWDKLFQVNPPKLQKSSEETKQKNSEGIKEKEEKKQEETTSTIPQASCGYSKAEINQLEKICWAEAQGEDHEGKVAVIAVILNRIKSEGFPNSVAGVIFKPGAFAPVSNGQFYRAKPNEETRKAVMAAINGCDPTNGCTYFYNASKVRPGNYVLKNVKVEKKIGRHSFGRDKKR